MSTNGMLKQSTWALGTTKKEKGKKRKEIEESNQLEAILAQANWLGYRVKDLEPLEGDLIQSPAFPGSDTSSDRSSAGENLRLSSVSRWERVTGWEGFSVSRRPPRVGRVFFPTGCDVTQSLSG
jgi:hypothetical protein